MSKKTLPRAIRPGATHSGGPEPQPRMSEPLPEATKVLNRRQDTVAAKDVAPDERKVQARKLVERFALWSGVAGLLPVPIVDLAAVAGLQIQMLRRLSQIYDLSLIHI